MLAHLRIRRCSSRIGFELKVKYCKPHIFSLLSNLYKNDFGKIYQNIQEDSVELLTTKLLHLIYRAGIDVKFA
jgi:hypothetical protein